MTPRRLLDLPPWVWLLSAVSLVFAGLQWLVVAPTGFSDPVRSLLYAVAGLPSAVLFLGAGRRPDLSPGLRRALLVVGIAFSASLLTSLIDALPLPALAAHVDPIADVVTSVVGLAGMLALPTRPLSRPDRLRLLLDLGVTIPGVVLFAVTLAALGPGPLAFSTSLLAASFAQLVAVSVLTLLAVRGEAVPSVRAFWFAIASMMMLLLAQTVWQLHLTDLMPDRRWFDLIYVCYGVLKLAAGSFYLRDPVATAPSTSPAQWLLAYNPMPIFTVPVLALLVVICLLRGESQAALISAIGLVPLLLLLDVRVALTSAQSLRWMREEGQRERQQHEEKMQAIGRLAGGVAHSFNNLMTAVIGHAQLGELDAGDNDDVREGFARIREAGERAARLTSRLLHYSGRQFNRRTALDLAATIATLSEELRALLPAGVALSVDAPPGALVRADASQVRLLLHELLHNAATALAGSGEVRITAAPVHLTAPLETPFLVAAPGDYVVIAVQDSGRGISDEVRPRIFDPFFSTQPLHSAAGLGLAAVYGIMAAHQGGIAVDSGAGGTTFRLYFPTDAAPSSS